jgi:uncharacterized integral membrane protein
MMKPKFSILLVLALIAVLLVATFAVVQAKPHTYDVSFTKWITEYPAMAGVVGGTVGPGTFAGEIIDVKVDGNMQYVDATYNVNGGKHSFTARIQATQDNSTGTGVITGSVTDGWLKGVSLTGEYTVFNECPLETPGNSMGSLCFQGVLHLHQGE